MEQAYDSMGWPTLQKILSYFGFLVFFSDLILECVLNPEFSILINGKPSNWIKANCGFRQGCPLSPYLVILLFADDIILFSEAKLKNMRTIKGIMKNYCGWTGQKVNINKSGILFEKAVSRPRRRKIKNILEFKEMKEFNYLGTKLALKRMSKSDFQFILEKILKMSNNWGIKFISLAGRITLVKHVILSIPSYHTTVSLVPKAILKEVEKLCRNFIWDKSNVDHGLHYVGWKKLCDLVEKGGRGIHSCLNKMGPLRAKLAWKYMKEKDSLLHKFLYPKYGSCWDNVNRFKSNYAAWKIIKNGGKSLRSIVRWSISNGHSIDVFKDI
ncbi:Putative ribonuclease H protein [Dendrobium catenatum]|uniref:Ribonuclease H protein n=1 Tax=Dendrobium catenatum TaxID=906689 RepID=A0A2I0VL06_9ASPA|nr:Putative ribonuclease H protein [Dendrobium catenatum]